jgi:hypothetical protein
VDQGSCAIIPDTPRPDTGKKRRYWLVLELKEIIRAALSAAPCFFLYVLCAGMVVGASKNNIFARKNRAAKFVVLLTAQ